jgi:hypothetical protein
MYPGAGTEWIMALIGFVAWIIWHIWQIVDENGECRQAQKLFKEVGLECARASTKTGKILAPFLCQR